MLGVEFAVDATSRIWVVASIDFGIEVGWASQVTHSLFIIRFIVIISLALRISHIIAWAQPTIQIHHHLHPFPMVIPY